MPDVSVTLTPWYYAKDNPPAPWEYAVTDRGYGLFIPGEHGGWEHHPDGKEMEPSVWCDPSPPDMSDPLGPLTADDLREIAETAEAWVDEGHPYPSGLRERIRRLRRALEKIGET